MNLVTRDPEPYGNPAFNQNPYDLDKDLVTRSTLVCGGGKLSKDEYNLGLHVMALFVVMFQSTLACSFPLICKRFPRLRIPPTFLFFARHFGTGVLIATAFVHLVPTAFISLLDPCLPPFWNEQYPAMPGAIAMGGVFFVTIIEMVFTRGNMIHGGASRASRVGGEDAEGGKKEKGRGKESNGKWFGMKRMGRGKKEKEESLAHQQPQEMDDDCGIEDCDGEKNEDQVTVAESDHIGGEGGVGPNGFGMAGRRRSRSLSFGRGMREIQMEQIRRAKASRMKSTDNMEIPCENSEENADEITATPASVPHDARKPDTPSNLVTPPSSAPYPGFDLTPEQRARKAKLQVILLEMGILFHSIFIGMALSVTSGPGFVVFFIAILFHQSFEGLALGSRIALITWPEGSNTPWYMAAAYGLTTPIGQAIGLGLHTLYDPASKEGLLVVGIFNAISSGLLLYAGLVELLAEDFLSDESWLELTGKKRVFAFIMVILGAIGMGVVGGWA